MKSSPPRGRLRRALSIARVGAQTGVSWATARGTEAAAKKTADVLGELRGLAAKIGQTASYVDGLVPPEHRSTYEEALKKLQKATPSSPWSKVEQLLLQELGENAGELIESIERTPVASASIGQVHRATLKDGRQVAVKVQHAGIEEAVESDLKNMNMLSGLVTIAGPKGMKAGPIFDEVLLRFRQELDYENEARNQKAFKKLHADYEWIHIPEVIDQYSSKRVLTSEWVDGFALEKAATQSTEVRTIYAEAMWRFVFRGNLVGGAFNADPHPGNYIFRDDGRVTFLDFGCVQPLPEYLRKAASIAHRRAIEGESELFKEAVAQMLQTAGGEYGEAAYEYSRLCFLPLLSPSFTMSSDYAGGLLQGVKTMKKSMNPKDGSFVPPPPQLALMNRLQFGFYSVLAKLNVEANYQAVERSFLDEAVSLDQPLLDLD